MDNLINKVKIEFNPETLEEELKQYAIEEITRQCRTNLDYRLKYEVKTTNDKIGKAVATYLNEQNLNRIINNIFKETDLEKVIKECIERQIGKKVKKLLEEI